MVYIVVSCVIACEQRSMYVPMVLGTCITHQWCWVPVSYTNGAGYLYHTPMVLGTCITHQWCWVPASHTTYQWCWVPASHTNGTGYLYYTSMVLGTCITHHIPMVLGPFFPCTVARWTYFNCTDYVIELLAVTSPLINKLIQF